MAGQPTISAAIVSSIAGSSLRNIQWNHSK